MKKLSNYCQCAYSKTKARLVRNIHSGRRFTIILGNFMSFVAIHYTLQSDASSKDFLDKMSAILNIGWSTIDSPY